MSKTYSGIDYAGEEIADLNDASEIASAIKSKFNEFHKGKVEASNVDVAIVTGPAGGNPIINITLDMVDKSYGEIESVYDLAIVEFMSGEKCEDDDVESFIEENDFGSIASN